MTSLSPFSRSPLSVAVSAALLLAVGGCASVGGGGSASAPVAKPTTITDGVPAIDPAITAAAQKLVADKKLLAIMAELNTPASEKARFNQHMELVRIASPSRY